MLRVTLRNLFASTGRLVMAVLAIIMSMAFVTGSLIFVQTTTDAFDRLTRATTADLTVGPPVDSPVYGIPESLVAAIRSVPGVRTAEPYLTWPYMFVSDRRNVRITASATIAAVGSKSEIPAIGDQWRSGADSVVKLTRGREPHGRDEVVLDADSANRSKVRLGDTIRVAVPPRTFSAKVVGLSALTTFNPGNTRLYFDAATVRSRLIGVPGMVTSIGIGLATGHEEGPVRDSVAAVVGKAGVVRTRAGYEDPATLAITESTGFVQKAMLAFSVIALLVGSFLIFNTFSMLVARRTRELGLLRALGAGRGQMNRSVLVEAALLGLAGSLLGLATGVGLASVLKAVVATVGIDLSGVPLTLTPLTPVVACLLGTVVTLASAHLPARQAGRVSPMAALREIGEQRSASSRRRTIAGVGLLVVGAAALAAPPTSIQGMALTLAALIVLGPALVGWVMPVATRIYPRLFGTVGRLGSENALRNPRRTAATAASLTIGVALATAMSVAAASQSASLSHAVDRTLGADFMIGAETGRTTFGPEVAAAVRAVPGVDEVIAEKVAVITVAAGGKTFTTKVYGEDPAFTSIMTQSYIAGSVDDSLAHGKLILTPPMASDLGVSVGSTVLASGEGGSEKLTVGAIQKEEPQGSSIGRNRTQPTLGKDVLKRLVPDAPDTTVYATLAEGADAGTVGAALKSAVIDHPQVVVRNRDGFKTSAQGQVGTLLNLVYVLLAMAIVIAILGIVNTLALSVVERTREIGLLRAVGASRRQIRTMIRLESVLIAVFGTVPGLLLGLAWGTAMQRPQEGVGELVIPWATVGAVMAAAVVVGFLAALLPARRAARLDLLTAIAAA